MTITANSTYTTITITSSSLSDAAWSAGIDTVTLYGYIDCTAASSDTIIEGDVTSGSFVVDLSEVFGVTDPDDGILGFKLVVENTSGVDTVEWGCLLVDDNGLLCDIAERYAQCINDAGLDCDTLEMGNMYTVLKNAGSCEECDCDDFCTIYTKLTNELANTNCDSC